MSELKNIDRIFVLSLKTSIERQLKFKENFPELIKLNIFEWFLVDRDNKNTERGCYTSHQNIIKFAKEKGYKTILIMEDDVKLLVPWKEFIDHFNNLKRPENWKTIQFGYIPIKTTKTSSKNLYEMNCGYFAEVYLVNVSLLNVPDYDGIQIDCFLFCNGYSHLDLMLRPQLTNKSNKDTYAYNPRLFQQNFQDSDIGHDNTIILVFYNFYNYLCKITGCANDITELSSYINLLLLSFFIVFGLFSLILLFIFMSIKTYYSILVVKFLILVIISILISVLSVYYFDSNKMIII